MEANEYINDYLKPIFSFTLKRTKTIQEAEDLAQEIIIKVYKALNNMDSIYSIDSYIWRIAHNTMANYYRGKARSNFSITRHSKRNSKMAFI